MTTLWRQAAVVAAALLLLGADGSDRTLDLTAPQSFPIHGDVPILPPPVPPAPAASPAAPQSFPSALPAGPLPSPARESAGAPPGSARESVGAPPGSARPLPGATPRPAPPPLFAPAPLPAPAPVARPPAPPAPVGPATFTVQVGAFRNGEQARALAERLVARGYDAYVMTVDLGPQGGQGTWHRVRVGRFPDRQPAVELATRLADAERVPAQVLRETAPVR